MYDYQTEKPKLFTEEGQATFLAVRDRVVKLIIIAGAVRMQEALNISGIGVSGESWTRMACVDRMVELGEIAEIEPMKEMPGQYRVFSEGAHFPRFDFRVGSTW